MRDETKQGQEWISELIQQASSVDVKIEWAQDDDVGPPVKPFYRVAVETPEGNRGSERIRTTDIDGCADEKNAEVRARVGQQIMGLLHRLGIAK
jgi:hypothetical protein